MIKLNFALMLQYTYCLPVTLICSQDQSMELQEASKVQFRLRNNCPM
jgi:hypothetical protein